MRCCLSWSSIDGPEFSNALSFASGTFKHNTLYPRLLIKHGQCILSHLMAGGLYQAFLKATTGESCWLSSHKHFLSLKLCEVFQNLCHSFKFGLVEGFVSF